MKNLAFRLLGVFVIFGFFFSPVLAAPVNQTVPTSFEPEPPRSLYSINDKPPYYPEMRNQDEQTPAYPTSFSVPLSKIAFQSYRDKNYEIYIAEGDGTGLTRLTNNKAADINPSLNIGCTRVAFASNRAGNYEIYSMNIDGAGLARLTNNNKDDVAPDWSSDGTQIVFQSYRDGQSEIYIMDADGSHQTRLTNDLNYDGMPAWSPDGSKIVFITNRSGVYSVAIMNPDGNGLVQLSNEPYSAHPSWSPDGNQIAFDADVDNDGWQELYVMLADGSQRQRILTPFATNSESYAGSWSPDGKYISFTQLTWMYVGDAWQLIVSTVYVIDPTNFVYYIVSSYDDMDPDWQTTDGVWPVSGVSSLPAESPATIIVNWSIYQIGPSGLRSFDVDVREGSTGTWTRWQNATTATTAAYTGIGGHTYYFRSRACSYGGLIEEWPENYDTFTQVESYPPRTFIQSLPDHIPYGSIVHWNGIDIGGSGIQNYEIQIRDSASGDWVEWIENTTNTREIFLGDPGHTYFIRVRGIDKAKNVEPWHAGEGEASTTVYSWEASGNVFDNTDAPVANAEVTVRRGTTISTNSDREGSYQAFTAEQANSYVLNWQKPAYAQLPDSTFYAIHDVDSVVVMPPADNIIQNDGFEDDDPGTYWIFNGLYPLTITNTVPHTGKHAVNFGMPKPDLSSAVKIGSAGVSATPELVVDQSGIVHAIWMNRDLFTSDIFYSKRDLNGNWSSPENISRSNNVAYHKLAVDASGVVHVVWSDAHGIYYANRQINGFWSAPFTIDERVIQKYYDPQPIISINGEFHLIWTELDISGPHVFYAERNSSGNWSAPVNLTPDISVDYSTLMLDNQDVLHLVVCSSAYIDACHLYYRQKPPNQPWSQRQFVNENIYMHREETIVDKIGQLHVIYDGGSSLFYLFRDINGYWSTPVKISDSDGAIDYNSSSLAIGPDGTLHVIWRGYSKVEYSSKTFLGYFDPPTMLDTSYNGAPKLAVDDEGTVTAVWIKEPETGGSRVIDYSWRDQEGKWVDPKALSGSALSPDQPVLTLGRHGQPHFAWLDSINGEPEVFYRGPSMVPQTGEANLSQRFTIPVTMTAPTLSFLYQLEGASTGAGLSVQISDSLTTTQVMAIDSDHEIWTHAWTDFSRWSGQTITLTFSLKEVDGLPFARALIDEVSVGSAHPDVWVSAHGKSFTPPGAQVVYQLTYGNRGGLAAQGNIISATLPAELEFVSASLPPAITGSTLTWSVGDLPAKSGPYTIFITATVSAIDTVWHHITLAADITTPGAELEVENNHDQVNTTISWAVFLPFTRKE